MELVRAANACAGFVLAHIEGIKKEKLDKLENKEKDLAKTPESTEEDSNDENDEEFFEVNEEKDVNVNADVLNFDVDNLEKKILLGGPKPCNYEQKVFIQKSIKHLGFKNVF